MMIFKYKDSKVTIRNVSLEIEILSCRSVFQFCRKLDELFQNKEEYSEKVLNPLTLIVSILLEEGMIKKEKGRFKKGKDFLVSSLFQQPVIHFKRPQTEVDYNNPIDMEYVYSDFNWTSKDARL